jgi:hypothetical protein
MPDLVPQAQAWLAFATVDVGLQLEIAAAAIRVHEIAQAAAPGLDGLGPGFRLNGGHQPLDIALEGNAPSRRARVDAGAVQAFRRVDVADTHDAMAVHQRRFSSAALEPTGGLHTATAAVNSSDRGSMPSVRIKGRCVSGEPSIQSISAEAARIAHAAGPWRCPRPNIRSTWSCLSAGWQLPAPRCARLPDIPRCTST